MMRKLIIISICFFITSSSLQAQELFPLCEPASNIPKGVLGLRAISNTYKEYDVWRNMSGVRVMYGLTSRLSIFASFTGSNHHGIDLPTNLVNHTHLGNQTLYFVSPFQRGIPYPYLFNGTDLYAKFRVLSFDGIKTHLRVALYGEWSNVSVAHDEAEPNLMDDTKGYGSGLIVTYLKNHFAISLTSGFIIPGAYLGTSFSPYGQAIPTTLEYGKAFTYNLSMGYLLYPKHYSSYKQVNVNLYTEFTGKTYGSAAVYQLGAEIPIQTPLLQAGNYVDVHPGIQFIFNSNLRLDLSVGLPFIQQSYTHFYPFTYIAVQRYFYNPKKQ